MIYYIHIEHTCIHTLVYIYNISSIYVSCDLLFDNYRTSLRFLSVYTKVRCMNIYRRKGQSTLQLDYFQHEHFKEYFRKMNLVHVQHYMRALFEALAHLHAHGGSSSIRFHLY